MHPGPEALLVAVLAGLYVYDAGVWLYGNEAVLTRTRRGWQAGFAARFGLWRGRHFYLPSLLAPWRPVFKLVWQYQAPVQSQPAPWPGADAEAALRHFGVLVASLFVTLFIGLPVVVLGRQGDATILALFGIVYLHVIAICVLLWRRKAALRLAPRQLGALAFELLVCPPFAVNVVRRLTLDMKVGEDFFLAAARLLPPERLYAVQRQLVLRLDDEIAAEAEDTERMRTLVERRASLLQTCPP